MKKITFLYPEINKKINSGGSFRINQNIELLKNEYEVNLVEIISLNNFKNKIGYFKYILNIKKGLKKNKIIFMEFPKYIFLIPFNRKIIYSAHNFETLLRWDLFIKIKSLKAFINFFIFFIAEFITLYRADRIVTITGSLSKQLSKFVFNNKATTLLPRPLITQPNYVHTEKLQYLFIGSFEWKPNKEAYDNFIQKIVPILIKKSNLKRTFIFIGNGNDKIKDLIIGNISIKCVGYVEDLAFNINNSRAIFIPISSGGGLKIKLLEAISYEVPIITTIKGSEGLEDYFHLLRPSLNFQEFAYNIIALDNKSNIDNMISNIKKVKYKLQINSISNWNNLFKSIVENDK